MSEFPKPLRGKPPAPAQGHESPGLARTCFADEIDIDFPSIAPAVDRVRETFMDGEEPASVVKAVTLTLRQASSGAIVPIELGLQKLCACCGGRGETWAEPCDHCAGTGEREHAHHVHLAFPAGVADGSRFRFVVTPPAVRTTRVDVTISVA